MSEGRLASQWAQTSELWAALVNGGFNAPKKRLKGSDLNPYAKKAAAPAPTKIPSKLFIQVLGDAMVKKGKKGR